MKAKAIICVLVASIFLMVSAYAQQWPTSNDIMGKIQEKMNLNQEQLAQVRLIIDKNMADRQKISPQLDAGLTQAQAEPLDTELYLKLSEVLTRSQMDQWNMIHQGILDKADDNQKS